MKIAIIGAGWYGVHLACSLAKKGHDVTLFEKNSEILNQISGNFGVRLHLGPHYPRSDSTRLFCRKGFLKFMAIYQDLLIPHLYSIYALGTKDADGKPSKVSAEKFKSVCKEARSCRELDVKKAGFTNLLSAYKVDEPSIAVGERLRSVFNNYLKKYGVKVLCNYFVTKITKPDPSPKQTAPTSAKMSITNDISTHCDFDSIINATSYQAFLPTISKLPFDLKVTYQPCLALVYKDMENKPGSLPISFIVMDGWFPCLMPLQENINTDGSYDNTYIMTHGKWTIMGSFSTPGEAENILNMIDDQFILDKIQPPCEKEMSRFWPAFSKRFKFDGWRGAVIAKPVTRTEHRTAITFKIDNIIYILPGKVSNIFETEEEVNALLLGINTVHENGCEFVQNGVLSISREEIIDKPSAQENATSNLQTYKELTDSKLTSNESPDFSPEKKTTSTTILTHNPRRQISSSVLHSPLFGFWSYLPQQEDNNTNNAATASLSQSIV